MFIQKKKNCKLILNGTRIGLISLLCSPSFFIEAEVLWNTTNTQRGFHVETTWKRPFPRLFNVESMWCVCSTSVGGLALLRDHGVVNGVFNRVLLRSIFTGIRDK